MSKQSNTLCLRGGLLQLHLPHGVKQRPVVFNPQQFIRHGHVMGHRLLPIVEERIRRPDFTRHQIVQGQDIHGAVKCQPLVLPALPEEDVYGVLLRAQEINEPMTQTAQAQWDNFC